MLDIHKSFCEIIMFITPIYVLRLSLNTSLFWYLTLLPHMYVPTMIVTVRIVIADFAIYCLLLCTVVVLYPKHCFINVSYANDDL